MCEFQLKWDDVFMAISLSHIPSPLRMREKHNKIFIFQKCMRYTRNRIQQQVYATDI